MIILDTCAMVFDALCPEKLSVSAGNTIKHAEKQKMLFCCDISLWEVAMLVQKKRIQPGTDIQNFLNVMLTARSITVLEITTSIAAFSVQNIFHHHDPADRLIASTALYYEASLLTC